MKKWNEELRGYNFDNGAFEKFGWEVTINDDNGFRVKSNCEEFDFNTMQEVIEHLEIFED